MSERRCTICGAPLESGLRSVFCSGRCRTIDLSRWLSEEYRIRGGEDEEAGGLVRSTDRGGDASSPDGREEDR